VLNLRTPDIGLAYIYFDHQQAQSLKPADYIANLVRQLEEQKEKLSTSIQSKFNQLPSKTGKPSLQDLKTFLSDSLKSFRDRIYIILDGFDECKEDGRTAIIDSICSLIPGDRRLSFFVATRPVSNVNGLESSFGNLARIIEVTTKKAEQSQDIKQFIDGKLFKGNLEIGEPLSLSEGIFRKAEGS